MEDYRMSPRLLSVLTGLLDSTHKPLGQQMDDYLRHYNDNLMYYRLVRYDTVGDIFSLLGVEISGNRANDLGCGTGWFTNWLREQGVSVFAIDYAEERINKARRDYEGIYTIGDITTCSPPNLTSFLWDVLEHLANPRQMLHRLSGNIYGAIPLNDTSFSHQHVYPTLQAVEDELEPKEIIYWQDAKNAKKPYALCHWFRPWKWSCPICSALVTSHIPPPGVWGCGGCSGNVDVQSFYRQVKT